MMWSFPPIRFLVLSLGLVIASIFAPCAWANGDDVAFLETFIKFKQSAIAADSAGQPKDATEAHDRLVDALEQSGLDVPGGVRDDATLDAHQIAVRMAPTFTHRKRDRVSRSILDRAATPGGRESPDVPERPAEALLPLSTVGAVAQTTQEATDQHASRPSESPVGSSDDPARSYILGPGDTLDLVYLDKELAPGGQDNGPMNATVNLEGKVVLPLLGVVQAAGSTVEQFRHRVLTMYRRYIHRPHITIFVREYHSTRVYVLGEVNRTGVVPLTGERLSLFELLAMAGGVNDHADRQHIIVLRGEHKYVVDLQKELETPAVSAQFFVQPGDRIIVPRPLHKVTILGGVNHAGEFEYEPGQTLLQAIAQAGSFNENARKDRIRVIRKKRGGKVDPSNPMAPTETLSVNVNQILRGKRPDFPLMADDTVFVSEY